MKTVFVWNCDICAVQFSYSYFRHESVLFSKQYNLGWPLLCSRCDVDPQQDKNAVWRDLVAA